MVKQYEVALDNPVIGEGGFGMVKQYEVALDNPVIGEGGFGMAKRYEKASELLRDAADLLEINGKCVGAFHDPREGSYCAIGALRKRAFNCVVVIISHKNEPVYKRARDALEKAVGWAYFFSDNHDKAAVIDAMRATANRLARKGD